ncbi:MAG: glutamate--tRNA ligase [Pseudomonadota bacterium]
MITRFAPSPTGMLHIGGARTALFNALLARHHDGKFLLRIEDTDKTRSTPEATQAILDAMDWLGLTPDEPPVFQSSRAERHSECARELIERDAAFRCYTTPEELEARRAAGMAAREASKDDALSDADKAEKRAEADAFLAPFRSPYRDGAAPPTPDAPFTVRLRAPDDGDIVLSDEVQGDVRIKATEIDDLVLLRADGTPTYMLAVVVDDHDMGVNMVFRGDDHLRNTFRQMPIYTAMGWPLPKYGHMPMIHGTDGAKLSKRHGAMSTLAYRDMGYLPEGMLSYLTRLGWSHGDKEVFTWNEAVDLFDVAGVNRSPARLDLTKLDDVNAHFISLADENRLLDLVTPFVNTLTKTDDGLLQRIRSALPLVKTRAKTLVDLAEGLRFLWDANADNLNKKARKALRPDKLTLLANLSEALDGAETWTIEALHEVLDQFCAAHSLTMGDIGPSLRAAVTGGLPAPDLVPVLAWLGRDTVLARIDHHLPAGAGEGTEPH